MKILATGAAGMLGSSLVPAFAGAGHDVVATDIDLSDPRPWAARGPRLQWLDVRRREEVKDCFASVRPDLVLHLAAETSLEISDTDPDHAYLTNTVATKYVALQARAAGIPMVYISTAGVFDGTKVGAYTEFDRPNPVNTYGASKYEGELVVAGTVEEHYIIRAGWMVGGGAAKDHKFVSRIVNQLRDGAQTIYAVTDKLGTPTYTPEFARCLIGLLDSGAVRALPHGLRRRGQPLRRGRPHPAGARAGPTSSWSGSARTTSPRSSSRSDPTRRSCATWCSTCRG